MNAHRMAFSECSDCAGNPILTTLEESSTLLTFQSVQRKIGKMIRYFYAFGDESSVVLEFCRFDPRSRFERSGTTGLGTC